VCVNILYFGKKYLSVYFTFTICFCYVELKGSKIDESQKRGR